MRVFGLVSLLVLASSQSVVAQDVHESIQGTWQLVALQDGGRTAPDEIVQAVQWVVADSQIMQVAEDDQQEFTYVMDQTKSPMWIDLRHGSRVAPGIVEIDGDTLRVCYAEARNAERSTAFESLPDGPNDVLMVFTRVDR